MKRKVLVLDAFTNGHEAAQQFIKRQGWDNTECELIFCGTHENLFNKIAQLGVYAVVPVHNSIAGEITEVVSRLNSERRSGISLVERDRIDLPINQCLLAHKSVKDAKDLEAVVSHEKALQQCGKYLESIGIGESNRRPRASTGTAAKEVASLDPGSNVGAVAPRLAAEQYGLNVLAENIQDVRENYTTFVLLEHR